MLVGTVQSRYRSPKNDFASVPLGERTGKLRRSTVCLYGCIVLRTDTIMRWPFVRPRNRPGTTRREQAYNETG